MLSTASSNFDVKPNSIDLRPNFTENFVSLKNDNGLPIMNDNHSINKLMNTFSQSLKVKNPNVMKKPRDNDLEVLEFFLYQFKCRPCSLKKGTCQDKSTCEGWHHEGERRRNPGIGSNFLYSEEPCPRLKTPGTSKWLKPTNCKDGDSCVFSHTLMEQMYHPNIYKTSLCTNFTASGGDQCQWGYFCTHAHGQKDIRNPNKKEAIKQISINHKQTQQQQQIRNNISEITNGRPLETFVSVMPKLYQNSSVDPISNENDMNYIEHDTFQHSDNRSPSRSYHTPSYHASLPPLNNMSSPSSKYSSITPSGPLTGQSAKLPQLLLPTTNYYYQSQVPTHAVTPNTASYESTYYNSAQTFPNRLWNERQQQYSWDINPNDVNLRQTPLAYTHGNNIGQSPMTESSFDMYSTSGRINNVNSNISPYHGSQRGVPSTTTNTTINSPSQRPMQLPRPHSATFTVSNSKLQVSLPSNPAGLNQSTHHMTPTYTIGHVPRYSSQTPTYQVYTPQTQVVGTPMNLPRTVNVDDMWTPASQHVLNKTLQSIPDIISPEQSVSLQVPETPLADLNNENMGNGSTKELKNNISYYFVGDDLLLSPLSTRTDDLKPTSAPRPCSDITAQTNEVIIAQLQAKINVLQKELESEKDKNQTFQTQDNGKTLFIDADT